MLVTVKRKWKPEEIAEIRARYQTSYISDLAEKFGVKPRQLTAIASYYGIKLKSQRFKIRRVKSEKSDVDLAAVMASKRNIETLIEVESDLTRKEKLILITGDLNKIIHDETTRRKRRSKTSPSLALVR